jgi:branched-subunit amino acid transport protein
MVVWAGVLLLGLVSYLMRLLPLLLGRGRRPGERAAAALRDAGMGGLAAITVLAMLGLHGRAPTLTVVGVAASAAVGALVALRRGSMAWGVGCGAAALALTWSLTALLHG